MNQTVQTTTKKIAAFLLTALLFIACTKDPIIPPAKPTETSRTKVEFSVESEALLENSYQMVQLNFSKKTTKVEKLVVSLSSDQLLYGTHYTTDPLAVDGKLTLDIAADAENAFIKVIPVDNDQKQEIRELVFTIVTDGTTLEPTGKKTSKLIFIDDDSKSELAFLNEAAAISENNQQGYDIQLNITPQSEMNGHVDIVFLSADNYGISWTSVPAAQNNRIRIPVQQGADKVSFRIKPVNDYLFTFDKTVVFRVSSTSANLTLPAKNEFSLVINNDDVENGSVRISEIRESFKGQELYYIFPVTVIGTVVSTKENLDPRIIYLQDETGGIAVKLISEYQPRVVGNKVSIDLEGGVLKEVNGNLEIHAISNAAVTPIGFDIVLVEELTLQQLYAKPIPIEGQLVTLKNVSFPDANGVNTLEGNRIITDGTRTVTVRTEDFATFKDKIIPQGRVSVTGILVEKNGQYIIIPQTATAVK